MDVVPGRYTTLWFEANQAGSLRDPVHRVLRHGPLAMRGQVVVVEPAATGEAARPTPRPADRLLAQRSARTLGEATARPPHGRDARRARRGCSTAACAATPSTAPPHIGPTWAGLYGATRAARSAAHVRRADEDYLTRFDDGSERGDPPRLSPGHALLLRRAARRPKPPRSSSTSSRCATCRAAPDVQAFAPAQASVPVPVPQLPLEPRDRASRSGRTPPDRYRRPEPSERQR